VGLLVDESVIDASAAYALYLGDTDQAPDAEERAAAEVPAELAAFIAAGEAAIGRCDLALAHLSVRSRHEPASRSVVHARDEVDLRAPLPRHARLFCAGTNYADHAARSAGAAPGDTAAVEAMYKTMRSLGLRGFIALRENVIASGEAIIYPARTDQLDFEGEIAVVIGAVCKDVAADEAHRYFYGYVLVNDVTARRVTPVADNPGSRFARDKNFDTSKCVGPYLAVGEFPDPKDITWETRLNGVVRQKGHTNDMIYSFAEILEHVSADMTLYPGDIISGGTASGTCNDSTPRDHDGNRDPAAFLAVGDVIEISNPVLGTLANHVVAKPDR
jgi:acylpyruvate hydrolase